MPHFLVVQLSTAPPDLRTYLRPKEGSKEKKKKTL